MSSDSAESPPPLTRTVRTVTPPYRGRSDEEMNVVGVLLFAGVLVLLIPLGPILLVVWILSRLRGASRRRTGS
jgi:hypothetical protein